MRWPWQKPVPPPAAPAVDWESRCREAEAKYEQSLRAYVHSVGVYRHLVTAMLFAHGDTSLTPELVDAARGADFDVADEAGELHLTLTLPEG